MRLSKIDLNLFVVFDAIYTKAQPDARGRGAEHHAAGRQQRWRGCARP